MKITKQPSIVVMAYQFDSVGTYYFHDFPSAAEFMFDCIDNKIHFTVFAEVEPTPCKHTKKKVYKKKKTK
jgi:hypothetical protein